MRRSVLFVLLAALVVSASVAPGQTPDPSKYPVVGLKGKNAPGFDSDFAINGTKTSLPDLKDKVVLLDFWAVWCGPCRAVFPDLARLHKEYNGKGLEIIGVTRYYKKYEFKDGKLAKAAEELGTEDEQKMLASFVSHFKLPYRIQTSTNAFANYKITGIPTAVLIDKKGVIQLVKIGAGKAGIKELEGKIKELLAEK